MKTGHAYLLGIFIACCSSPISHAQENFTEALRKGDGGLDLRLRYENVSPSGTGSAKALTLRTRITYASGSYHNVGLYLEMDDITALNSVGYNDGAGRNPGAVTIADPEGTEVNQAYLTYNNWNTQIRYGRQRILLDNQRFVGGVGWRQNEQTYDAFAVSNNSIADLTFFYSYIHNVNRIFGEAAEAGDHKQATHLTNARYSGLAAGNMSTYAYLIDNETVPALSSNTYGARWEGHVNRSFTYNLEYAVQSDAGNNPANYAADYSLAEVAAELQAFRFLVGYEVMGSDGGAAAFRTPLATLHAFQGWTDKFVNTPSTGVEDRYLKTVANVSGTKLTLAFHDLTANEGNTRYGSEVGFMASRRFGSVSLTVKYADYNAESFATDTRKIWLMAQAAF